MNIFRSTNKIPEGYHLPPITREDDGATFEKVVKGEARGAASEDIPKLYLPSLFGDHPTSPRSFTRGHSRSIGYLPLWGFVEGYFEIDRALRMVYSRVLLGENEVIELIESRELGIVEGFPVRLEDRAIVKINLSVRQKMSIVARSVLLFARGLITFCQLGIVFAPFDVATNWYNKRG